MTYQIQGKKGVGVGQVFCYQGENLWISGIEGVRGGGVVKYCNT